MQRDNYAGLWILTDSEMFRLSLYADEACKQYRAKGAKELSDEAKEMAQEIDSILELTEYYRMLSTALAKM